MFIALHSLHFQKKMNAYTIGPIGIQCPVATGHCPVMKIIHSLP